MEVINIKVRKVASSVAAPCIGIRMCAGKLKRVLKIVNLFSSSSSSFFRSEVFGRENSGLEPPRTDEGRGKKVFFYTF